MQKKIPIGLSILIAIMFILSIAAFAHSGKTDSQGGHYNHATGEYHFHHGYGAHQHPNGVCPYGGEDISRSNGSSSGSNKSSNSTTYFPGSSSSDSYETSSGSSNSNSKSASGSSNSNSTYKKNTSSSNSTSASSESISRENYQAPPYKTVLNADIENDTEEDTMSYIFFLVGLSGIVLLLLCLLITWLYNKLYGNAKAVMRNISEKVNDINTLYHDMFIAMQQLSHTGSTDEASKIQKYAQEIKKDLKDLKELYTKKELKKYIPEEERRMKFKKIDQELKHLEDLCHLIETKYYGKTQLSLPQTTKKSTISTKTVFLYIKCRRQDSKARYFHCPAKIKCTKTVANTENAYGENLKHSEQTTYEVIDFYFSNNCERKPAEPGKLNHFENTQQKGYVNTIKDGKSEAFEVILTEEDATADYRANQIIDTVRKVAKDENLTAKAKKSIKGLKLSYAPPNFEKQ